MHEGFHLLLCEGGTFRDEVFVVSPGYSEEVCISEEDGILMWMRREMLECGRDAAMETEDCASKRLEGMGGERVECECCVGMGECECRVVR